MIKKILITSIILLFPTVVLSDAQRLTIVYPPEENAFHDAAAEIIRQAYGKLEIEIDYQTLPAERALYMSNDGQVDGELVRIEGIENKYPNLIRVPFSHVTADQMAFARDASIRIDGWESLRPYAIAFHRGYKVAEHNTEGMNRIHTKDDAHAFNLLEQGRVDIVIANRYTGDQVIRESGIMNVAMLMPPVQRDPLYHYLHVRHRDLVKKVTKVLKEMERNGEVARIREQFGLQGATGS